MSVFKYLHVKEGYEGWKTYVYEYAYISIHKYEHLFVVVTGDMSVDVLTRQRGVRGLEDIYVYTHMCIYSYIHIYVFVVFTGNMSVDVPTSRREVQELEDMCIYT